MTAATYRSSALTVPPTQNTAPVLEFSCLYTHDLRRKQKRWQDGFLRYHTFNKRVMLYDVPRNFIGDMHWKAEALLQEGDEMTLEKSGVIVQVAEEVGRTETDLTELLQSARKPRNGRPVSPAKRGAASPVVGANHGTGTRQPMQMKHRSLNALLGPTKGPIGKSVIPLRSPYEMSHADVESQAWEDHRSPKRQRIDGVRSVVQRDSAGDKPSKSAATPFSTKLPDHISRKKVSPRSRSGRSRNTESNDLRHEKHDAKAEKFLPHFSSDALQPPSSPVRCDDSTMRNQVHVITSSPASQMQKASPWQAAQPKHHAESECYSLPTNKGVSPSRPLFQKNVGHSSPTSCTSKRVELVEPTTDRDQSRRSRREPTAIVSESSESRFRLAAPAPKKKRKLLCQDQVSKPPSRATLFDTDSRFNLPDGRTSDDEVLSEARKQHQMLEERLARLGKKHRRVITQERLTAIEHKTHVQKHAEQAQTMPPRDVPGTSCQTTPCAVEPPHRQPSPVPTTRDISDDPDVGRMMNDPSAAEQNQSESRPGSNSHICHPSISLHESAYGNGPKRRAGAPMRFTPAPSITKALTNLAQFPDHKAIPIVSVRRTSVPPPSAAKAEKMALMNKIKKPLQRAVSLNITANGVSAVVLGRPLQSLKSPELHEQAQPPCPPDPWSRGAFDLFDWRPPGWDEDAWSVKA